MEGGSYTVTMFQVRFKGDKPSEEWKAVDHLDGGWIRCYNPNSDHINTKRYPPTEVEDIVEDPYL